MTACYSWLGRWSSLLIVVTMLVAVTVHRPYLNGPPIRSDGEGYHIWTRAILERDLSFRNYQGRSGVYLADARRHVYQNKYPPGVALLRLPVMAFLVDLRPGAPMISKAEHVANQVLAALALAFIGFTCLRTCQMLSLPARDGHAALLAMTFGTGLFHYATYDACFSHVYSALGVALLVWLGVRALVTPPHRLPVVAAGVTTFFFLLIRNTNVLLLSALAVAYLYGRRRSGLGGGLRDLAVLAGGAAAAVAVQLAYNCYAHGALTFSSYGSETFYWHRPMAHAVLFSYERGLFTYYPVLGVMLAAAWLAARTRPAAAWFTVLLLGYAVLYGFWSSWMLGAGFGHRGFVELAPIGGVLFAAALGSLSERWRLALLTAAGLCTVATVNFMWGYWQGLLPMDGTRSPIYWSFAFGRQAPWRVLWRLTRDLAIRMIMRGK